MSQPLQRRRERHYPDKGVPTDLQRQHDARNPRVDAFLFLFFYFFKGVRDD